MATSADPSTPASPPVASDGGSRHVVLIGLMGAGKTEVGRALAGRTRQRHVDLDRAITQLAGRSIGVIFHEGGESSFRDIESQCLALQLAAGDPIVLSTGGGVLVRDGNRAALADGPTVVWLRARAETLADRVGDGAGRPLLEGRDPLEVLSGLVDERHLVYAEAADLVVDTDGRSIDEVADAVAEALVDTPGAIGASGGNEKVGDRT